jgi:glycosyltransferase involved in cell wall biosynthesis
VIDDASMDASAAVIARFDDPRTRFIRHRENLGPAHTITEGLYAARGAYVARIDPDDRYRPHFLNRTVEILAVIPTSGITPRGSGRCNRKASFVDFLEVRHLKVRT